jgi:hypothetical protein
MDRALADAGFTTHPMCDPAEVPQPPEDDADGDIEMPGWMRE